MKRKVLVYIGVHHFIKKTIKMCYVMTLEEYKYMYRIKTDRPLKKKLTKKMFFEIGKRERLRYYFSLSDFLGMEYMEYRIKKLGEYIIE